MSASTIFALSSGRPPAAIAVVRVTGPQAGAALDALGGNCPSRARRCSAGCAHPETKAILDEALALWFPGPNSETGEDMAELQLHGGRAVIAAVLAALGQLPGLRPAEPGEFTRRAFENGQLDLTAVEGLADLVVRRDRGAARARRCGSCRARSASRAEAWRQRLIEALALVEARHRLFRRGGRAEDLMSPGAVMLRGN